MNFACACILPEIELHRVPREANMCLCNRILLDPCRTSARSMHSICPGVRSRVNRARRFRCPYACVMGTISLSSHAMTYASNYQTSLYHSCVALTRLQVAADCRNSDPAWMVSQFTSVPRIIAQHSGQSAARTVITTWKAAVCTVIPPHSSHPTCSS